MQAATTATDAATDFVAAVRQEIAYRQERGMLIPDGLVDSLGFSEGALRLIERAADCVERVESQADQEFERMKRCRLQ